MTEEEIKKLEQTVDYFGHWYDVIGEVISYEDFVACDGSYTVAKEKGLMRLEGKDYVVQDGDIMHFRFAN